MLNLANPSITPIPAGTLSITLQKASITCDTESQGKLNLFCEVYLGEQYNKSNSDNKNNCNPRWNETITFKRKDETHILIEVKSKTIFFLSKYIGECSINLSHVFKQHNLAITTDLTNNHKVIGLIEVKLKWEPAIVSSSTNSHLLSLPPDVEEFLRYGIRPSSSSGNSCQQQQVVVMKAETAPQFIKFQTSGMTEMTYNEATGEVEDEPVDMNLPDDKKCTVCLVRARTGVFYRCGHNCCCSRCGRSFIGSPCPVCNKHVDDFVKVYKA